MVVVVVVVVVVGIVVVTEEVSVIDAVLEVRTIVVVHCVGIQP